MASFGGVFNLQFVDETGNVEAEEGFSRGRKRRAWEAGCEVDDDSDSDGAVAEKPRPGKKTRGRVKIRMAYISDKVRRYTTFSKRKTGIMKKAYELAVLTGTQVMLLVASETGHVYTFATRKLQPVIMSEGGKALIQTCLNSPDTPPSPPSKDAPEVARSNDERMNPLGFEEPNLTYSVVEEKNSQFSVKQQNSKPDVQLKSDAQTSVRHAHSLPVLTTALDQSTASSASEASASHPSKPPRQQVTTVGAYLAALKEQGPASVLAPENLVALSTHPVTKSESTAAQIYYKIEGSNQLISIPSGATSGGMLMYPGAQTVVLPVQGAAGSNMLKKSYVLNIANASDLKASPDSTGGISQQLFTLPFTVSSAPISSSDSMLTARVNPLLGFVDNGTVNPTLRK